MPKSLSEIVNNILQIFAHTHLKNLIHFSIAKSLPNQTQYVINTATMINKLTLLKNKIVL